VKSLGAYVNCFAGIAWREGLRFFQQRGRFIAALVRPLVWLFIFAAGFRSVLGVSIIPPYETYVLYEEYITPGLAAMILLFSGMQSSLSMVYDREMGCSPARCRAGICSPASSSPACWSPCCRSMSSC
jgi:ABC-2 type transport system permease protein